MYDPPPFRSPGRKLSLTRRSTLTLALLAALPLPVPAPANSTGSGPAAPIEALYAALERLMHQGSSRPFIARFKEIAPVIERVFDLPYVLKLSVGLPWNGLDAATRARLLKAFRDFTIATYVANFDSYDGQKFEVLPQQRKVGADRIVDTRIIRSNGEKVTLDYVMRQKGQTWQAVDVLADGTISRVATQRSDFRATLMHGGADALIAKLKQKTAELSGGAV